MRGDDEHQTAHTPIALMLCSKLENLATMPRRAQAQHKCEDNIIDATRIGEQDHNQRVGEFLNPLEKQSIWLHAWSCVKGATGS